MIWELIANATINIRYTYWRFNFLFEIMKPTNNYWLNIITWNFGSWKTFWLWVELYDLKSKNPDVCIISNVPRAITDIYYNSIQDFQMILEHLYLFYEETNDLVDNYDSTRKDIVLVMDESQIYFPARWFADKKQKELREKLTIILTQCRKRYTRIWCAVQRTKMLDINFRRLADNIRFYEKTSRLWIKLARLYIFECWWAIDDLIWDDTDLFSSEEKLLEKDINNAALSSHQTELLDSLLVIKHPTRKLRREKNLTKHISWLLENVYHLTYTEFRKKLYLNIYEIPDIEITNQDQIPIFRYWKHLEDLYWNKLVKDENIYKYIN